MKLLTMNDIYRSKGSSYGQIHNLFIIKFSWRMWNEINNGNNFLQGCENKSTTVTVNIGRYRSQERVVQVFGYGSCGENIHAAARLPACSFQMFALSSRGLLACKLWDDISSFHLNTTQVGWVSMSFHNVSAPRGFPALSKGDLPNANKYMRTFIFWKRLYHLRKRPTNLL